MRKTVFVSHPVRGDGSDEAIRDNIERIHQIYLSLAARGITVIAPHILAYFFMDGSIRENREKVRHDSELHLQRGMVDEMWLYGERITDGMFDDMAMADRYGIKIIPMTNATREAMRRYDTERMLQKPVIRNLFLSEDV